MRECTIYQVVTFREHKVRFASASLEEALLRLTMHDFIMAIVVKEEELQGIAVQAWHKLDALEKLALAYMIKSA